MPLFNPPPAPPTALNIGGTIRQNTDLFDGSGNANNAVQAISASIANSANLANASFNDFFGNVSLGDLGTSFAPAGVIYGNGSALTNVTGTVIAGTKTATGTVTTTFTVTIGATMAATTYKVATEGLNALSSAVHYVTNKTTTTFDVVYLTGLSGTVSFDWILTP